MRAERLAVAASAQVTSRRHDRCHLAPHPHVALVRAPAGTCLCPPVLAQGCDLAKVLPCGIAVHKLRPLCGRASSRLSPQGPPFP
jgi:hypothetical protein